MRINNFKLKNMIHEIQNYRIFMLDSDIKNFEKD